MTELEAGLLGIVQGLSEFLPVSSSGHLVVVQALLGIHEEGILFEVAVHVATLASVLIFYRSRVVELIVGTLRGDRSTLEYVGKLIVATLPAVALVLVAGDQLDALFESPAIAGLGLLFTGAVLWTTLRSLKSAASASPTWMIALAIGCAQAVAIVPGVSRSGTTVAAALALGVAPVAAAEFSFLMSAVAIAGAAARAIPDLAGVDAQQLAVLGWGAATALISGIAAIWLFIRLLQSHGFHFFAYYTWAVGAFVLVAVAAGRLG